MTEAATTAPAVETPTYTPGAFVWHELGATDVAGAQKFYTALFGWTIKELPMGEMVYRMLFAGETAVGGMYPVDPGMGIPSYWMATVSVTDVDAAAKAAQEAGGKVVVPPADVPDMVRYAVLADAQGAAYGVCRSIDGDPPTTMPKAGEFCWDQLNTPDIGASATFYGKAIGWTLAGDASEGFQTFKMGDLMEASIVEVPAGTPAHWLSHIVVADLAESLNKVKSLGGKTLVDRIDVPGMGAFGVVQDPYGACFALFQGQEAG